MIRPTSLLVWALPLLFACNADAVTGSSAKAASAQGSATTKTCDVMVVAGEVLGDQRPSAASPVQASLEQGPDKTYCVFGKELSKASTLEEVKPFAPADCTTREAIGATELSCQGVTLVFGGPTLRLSSIAVSVRK